MKYNKRSFPTHDRARAEAKKLIFKGFAPLVTIDRKKGEWIVEWQDIETPLRSPQTAGAWLPKV